MAPRLHLIHPSTIAALIAATLPAAAAYAANCAGTSTGRVPLNDLGTGLYLGQFQGGLYPGGSNRLPPPHASAGLDLAFAIQPRNTAGQPDPNGRYVLISIGMSNTTQEFCGGSPCQPTSFMAKAAAHPDVNHGPLAIVDGAAGGQTASTWDDPNDANYERIRTQVLAPRGLSEAQVAAAWVKVANAGPTNGLPSAQADAYQLVTQMGNIARTLRIRYPNIRLVFFSSRIYAGYADTALNPEPYAYESGFAVKWVIEAQIRQMAGLGVDPRAGNLAIGPAAPWLGWGAYLWADGLTPRSDGLTWACSELANDGTHPAAAGRSKVSDLLLSFMLSSPQAAPWFRADGALPCSGDVNGDGRADQDDLDRVLFNFGACCNVPHTLGDLDGDGDVDQSDLDVLLFGFGCGA